MTLSSQLEHEFAINRFGRTQLVLARGQAPDGSVKPLQNQIVDTMLASVADALEAEKVSKSDNPLLEPVLNIASAWQKEQTTDQTALQRQSPAEAIKLTFQWPLTQSNPNEGVPPEPQANGAS